MTLPKRSRRMQTVKVYCTADQKVQIQNQAIAADSSVSDYILGLLIQDHAYGFERRKLEGALINAALYQRLGDLVTALQERPDADLSLVQEAIELGHEIRREIALKRLKYAFESALEVARC